MDGELAVRPHAPEPDLFGYVAADMATREAWLARLRRVGEHREFVDEFR